MTKQGGRPPVGPQGSIRLTPDEWAHVDHVAQERGLNRSAALRSIVRDHIAAWIKLARTENRTSNGQ